MTSTDGIAWTSQAAASDHDWKSVAYGRDGDGDPLWVAVASTGTGSRVMTSPDGITWTIRTSAADSNWNSVAFGDGLWVAVGNGGSGNSVMTSGATSVAASPVDSPAASPAASPVDSPVELPPSVSCAPLPAVVGATITCTVTGGNANIDILWRAAYNPVIAETGVTLDASGSGTFSFTVPAAALGEELTVELVEWTAPVSLGTVGGPVPTSVPSGEGPVPVWMLGLLALAGGLVLRRRSGSGWPALRVG